MIVAISGFLRVRAGLQRAAATNDPEEYVHDPAFQIISFFWVHGLPMLVLLALMIFAAKRLARNSGRHDVVQPDGLIDVLLDRDAPFGDRHDAAMDLADYDNPEAINALTKVKDDPSEDADIAEEAGQSLLEIDRRKRTN